MDPTSATTRLDLWLWSARFFKTRALAAAAVESGKVELNGQPTKRGKPVRAGDALRIRLGAFEHRVVVLALARRRGSATLAGELYRELPESREARERLAEQHRLAARLSGPPSKGRPTKHDRRQLGKLKGRE